MRILAHTLLRDRAARQLIMAHSIIQPEAFAKHIEYLVSSKGMTYLDALVTFCEERQIEPDQIAPFISDKIKTNLQREGIALHLLPKTSNTAVLPLE